MTRMGHVFILWNPIVSCMMKSISLQLLYCIVGHQSTDKLTKPLKRAELPNVSLKTVWNLKDIEKSWDPCQVNFQKPRRCRFTMREDKYFNHSVYYEVFYTDEKRYSTWLMRQQFSGNKAAQRYAIRNHLTSPSHVLNRCCLKSRRLIVHDAEKNFTAIAF